MLSWIERFTEEAGSFTEFTRSYKKFGLNINADGDLEYREWAPAAREVSIVIDTFLISHSSVTSINGIVNPTSSLRMTLVFGP